VNCYREWCRIDADIIDGTLVINSSYSIEETKSVFPMIFPRWIFPDFAAVKIIASDGVYEESCKTL